MTDVKSLLAVEVAVAEKGKGQADPSGIYEGLYKWIVRKGYMPSGSPMEKFLTGAMTGDYAQMKSEIMVPVIKISFDKN